MRVSFTSRAWDDDRYWADQPATLRRLNQLIEDARRSPFAGIGRPEPLRNELSGWWSRRITDEHRLVYRVEGKGEEQVLVISYCRFHYGQR